LCWNFSNVSTPYSQSFQIKDLTTRDLFLVLQLDQIWDMFAPRPPNIDWWFVLEASLSDGSNIDLWGNGGLFNWEGRPLAFDKGDVVSGYKRHRWFKYFERYANHQSNNVIRLHFGRYVCRTYNSKHSNSKRLSTFKMWWVFEFQQMDGSVTSGGRNLLWEHIC